MAPLGPWECHGKTPRDRDGETEGEKESEKCTSVSKQAVVQQQAGGRARSQTRGEVEEGEARGTRQEAHGYLGGRGGGAGGAERRGPFFLRQRAPTVSSGARVPRGCRAGRGRYCGLQVSLQPVSLLVHHPALPQLLPHLASSSRVWSLSREISALASANSSLISLRSAVARVSNRSLSAAKSTRCFSNCSRAAASAAPPWSVAAVGACGGGGAAKPTGPSIVGCQLLLSWLGSTGGRANERSPQLADWGAVGGHLSAGAGPAHSAP